MACKMGRSTYQWIDGIRLRHYFREDQRLKTFYGWPHVWLNKHELAKIGMIYTGNDDIVKCIFCQCEVGGWEPNDYPVWEHLRWSPNCPLLRRCRTRNVPIDAMELDCILPSPDDGDTLEISSDSSDDKYSDDSEWEDWEDEEEVEPEEPAKRSSNNCFTKLIGAFGKVQKALSPAVLPKPKDEASASDSKLCKICYEGEYNTAFLPCGHVVACAKCASSVSNCPMCRQPFTDVMRVYLT